MAGMKEFVQRGVKESGLLLGRIVDGAKASVQLLAGLAGLAT